MIYVVTGLPRTGTSMMMRALEGGGMTVYRDTALETKIMSNALTTQTYNPNPNGYYAMSLIGKDITQFDNLVIKPQINEITFPISLPYKMILMKRNEVDRAASYTKAFNLTVPNIFFQLLADLEAKYQPLVINYEDVIASPIKEFLKIKQDGWPITAANMVNFVDPNLKRFF